MYIVVIISAADPSGEKHLSNYGNKKIRHLKNIVEVNNCVLLQIREINYLRKELLFNLPGRLATVPM